METEGRLTFKSGLIYIGELDRGRAHGNGMLIYPNGNKFYGGFRDGYVKRYPPDLANGKLVFPDGGILHIEKVMHDRYSIRVDGVEESRLLISLPNWNYPCFYEFPGYARIRIFIMNAYFLHEIKPLKSIPCKKNHELGIEENGVTTTEIVQFAFVLNKRFLALRKISRILRITAVPGDCFIHCEPRY